MSRLVVVTLAIAGVTACSNCAGKPPPPVEPPPPGKPPSPWYEPPAGPPGSTPPVRPPVSGPPPGEPPGAGRHSRDLGRCRVFPADNVWNRDVSGDPVDPDSERYLRAMNAGHKRLHPDFGSNPSYGIPWFTVSRRAPKMKMQFKYDEESDPGPYPFPEDAPVEGGPDAEGDRHVIAIDRDECKLYEGFNCWFQDTSWACESGAVFDLMSSKLRPQGWTSADAAGLPIFPGLVRRDEVLAGEIKHALRFTVQRTQRAYVFPATHFASPHRDPNLPPLGLRVRLKRSFDLGGYSGHAKVILTALKRYGMILADNGADWFISGEANPKWEDDQLEPLKRVPASAFEVVRLGKIQR